MFQNLVEKPESEGERVKGDPARDLGTVHHICVSHLKELQAMSKTQVGLFIISRILVRFTQSGCYQDVWPYNRSPLYVLLPFLRKFQ